MKKFRPPKIENLPDKIKECIEGKKYTQTEHALSRQKERKITLAEVKHVLLTGYEEKVKTRFDEHHNTWNYSIRGKTKIEKYPVRVIIAFDERGMLIITAMFIGPL